MLLEFWEGVNSLVSKLGKTRVIPLVFEVFCLFDGCFVHVGWIFFSKIISCIHVYDILVNKECIMYFDLFNSTYMYNVLNIYIYTHIHLDE